MMFLRFSKANSNHVTEFLASREEVDVGMEDLSNVLEQMSGQGPEHQFLTPNH